jgi:hypothetical protein
VDYLEIIEGGKQMIAGRKSGISSLITDNVRNTTGHCLTYLEMLFTKSLRLANIGTEVTKFVRSDGTNDGEY